MTATTTDAPMLDIDAVAAQLSVCPMTVRRMVQTGKIRAVRVGSLIRIPRDALGEFIAANVILVPVSETGKGHASA